MLWILSEARFLIIDYVDSQIGQNHSHYFVIAIQIISRLRVLQMDIHRLAKQDSLTEGAILLDLI